MSSEVCYFSHRREFWGWDVRRWSVVVTDKVDQIRSCISAEAQRFRPAFM